MSIKTYRRHEITESCSSVYSRDISPPASGEEHIILVPASQDYPPIKTVPTSPTMDQDNSDTQRLSDPYLESAKLIYTQIYTKVIRPVSRISQVYLQINYKDTQGLTDLYLGSQYVQDHQMAKSSQRINTDQ